MQFPIEYVNGNTTVTIHADGTKVRTYDGDPFVRHPESIDVKITDYCDMGCRYCHESSTRFGMHGNLHELMGVLSVLPPGVELAIGGGNPLSHPGLVDFLVEVRRAGLIANITVNQGHLGPYKELLTSIIQGGLVHGVGISVTSNNFTHIKHFLDLTGNVVYHLIAGVNDIGVVDKLMDIGYCKVLVLGYKTYGFGVGFHGEAVDIGIKKWRDGIRNLVGKCTLSFDNLAIEQLQVRRMFTAKGWEKFYMGDDFCYTMYIDAVRQEFAPTSRSDRRVPFSEISLIDYFNSKIE